MEVTSEGDELSEAQLGLDHRTPPEKERKHGADAGHGAHQREQEGAHLGDLPPRVMDRLIMLVEALTDRRLFGVGTNQRNSAHRPLQKAGQATCLHQLVLESLAELTRQPAQCEQDQDVG